MMKTAKVRIGLAAVLLGAVFLLPTTFSVKSQSRNGRLSWPKKQGVYIAKSSATTPAFPRTLSGFRSENNKDFWGNSFKSSGSLRVFEGAGWEAIYEFPNTQNQCSAGVFMIRWRVANPNVRVVSAIGYSTDNPYTRASASGHGYMYGTNCEQPMFRFADNVRDDGANLVDVYYELKFWQAAP
jgi:hypothetical protein